MSKEQKSLDDMYRKTKTTHVWSDFQTGDVVRVVTPCVDFRFFYGETGIVFKSTSDYMGVKVVVHGFDGNYFNFNFEPQDLEIIKKCKWNHTSDSVDKTTIFSPPISKITIHEGPGKQISRIVKGLHELADALETLVEVEE